MNVRFSPTHPFRAFSRNVRLYLSTVAIIGFAVLGVHAVLLNLYLLRLGLGPEFIGLVIAAGQFVYSIFCLLGGMLGVRWGSRKVMILGVATLFVGLGSLPLVEFVPAAWARGWLLVTYALMRLGAALYLVNGVSFLSGATGPAERNHAFSMQAAAQSLLAFAGSLVGGLLPALWAHLLDLTVDGPEPYRYSLLLACLLLAPIGPLLLTTRTDAVDRPTVRMGRSENAPREQDTAKGGAAPVGLILLLSLVVFLRCAARGTVNAFANIYLDAGLGVPTAQIGALNAAGQLAAALSALTMPVLASRWGQRRTVVRGTLGMALILLPLATIRHWAAASTSFVGITLLTSITSPAITVYAQEAVSPAWRAAMSGATNMAAGMGFASTAALGGYLVVALDYQSIFWVGVTMAALGAVLFGIWVPRQSSGLRLGASD
jgi:MFS family permease